MSNLFWTYNGETREYKTIQEFLRDTAVLSGPAKAKCNFDTGFFDNNTYIESGSGFDLDLRIGDGITEIKPMLEFFAKAAPEMLIEALKKENAL